MPNVKKTTKEIAFSYSHRYNSKSKATIIFLKICDSGECSPLQEKINKLLFWVTMWPWDPRAHAPRYGRRNFQFSYQKYHSDNFFVNSRLWGMLSSLRKKNIKFIIAKLCPWGPRTHARTRARTRYGQGTYLWISFKLLWILLFFFF